MDTISQDIDVGQRLLIELFMRGIHSTEPTALPPAPNTYLTRPEIGCSVKALTRGKECDVFDVFMYPVSGIMKLWHLFLQSFLEAQTAWLVSIVLLVITVRSLIAPLNWIALRSTRIGGLLKPRLMALPTPTTVEEFNANSTRTRQLHEEYRYRPAVGCLPPLIMLPVLIGLYRLLRRMATAPPGTSIGLLSPAEVEDFRTTTFQDVPLPAYVAMPDSLARDFGVSGEQVRDLITPFLIAAIAFTVANMAVGIVRQFWTTNFNQKLQRRMFIFAVSLLLLIPVMLWWLAMHVVIPVAIILYWFCTNLYTLVLNCVLTLILNRRYPIDEPVHELSLIHI